jgi:hypothetical protein
VPPQDHHHFKFERAEAGHTGAHHVSPTLIRGLFVGFGQTRVGRFPTQVEKRSVCCHSLSTLPNRRELDTAQVGNTLA